MNLNERQTIKLCHVENMRRVSPFHELDEILDISDRMQSDRCFRFYRCIIASHRRNYTNNMDKL